MPSAFTEIIKDGITFEKFALRCARYFGALVMMRDDPLDAPIPEFKPDPHYAERVESIKQEINALRATTAEQLEAIVEAQYQNELSRYNELVAYTDDLRAKYAAMEEQVNAWTPPTEEHVGLKNFMLSQIADSVNWDCDVYLKKPVRQAPLAYYTERMGALGNQLIQAEKMLESEHKRTADRNKWVRELQESLKPKE